MTLLRNALLLSFDNGKSMSLEIMYSSADIVITHGRNSTNLQSESLATLKFNITNCHPTTTNKIDKIHIRPYLAPVFFMPR